MRLLPAALILIVFTVAGCGAATEPGTDAAETDSGNQPASATSAIYDFTGETVAGEPFNGSTLSGKPTVLWFWAPWCPTCRAQIAGVSDLAASRSGELNVVGVGALDAPEAISGFAAEVGDEVEILSDPEGEIWRHFKVTAQSTYVVLDDDGKQVSAGYLDDGELVELVDGLVG